MNDIYEVLFENFSVFSLIIGELLKKYCCLTHKRYMNWTTTFGVTKYLSLNTKNCPELDFGKILNGYLS